MPLTFKVFGGEWNGVERRIVATTSLKKAMEITGCAKDFICETGNSIEIAVAMGNPGVAFGYRLKDSRGPKTADLFRLVKPEI